MISLNVGEKYNLDKDCTVVLNDTSYTIDSILSLCLTKQNLPILNEDISIIVLGECKINKMIYDLDLQVEDKTLIIKPTRDIIFNHFSNKIPETRANAGLEHIDDLQMDLIFKVAQIMIDNGSLTLTENELRNYNHLKNQWTETTSTTLEQATYEIDYAFNGDGEIMPKGLKAIARENQVAYKEALEYFGYEY